MGEPRRNDLPGMAAVAVTLCVLVSGSYATPVRTGLTLASAAVACAAVAASVAVYRRRERRRADATADALARLTAGDWQARVRTDGQDEWADVGFRLNLLAERTGEQLDALNRQAADLNALVDALPDAVILADAQQRAVRINDPAARFLGIAAHQAVGQPIIALLGEAPIVDAYERLMTAGDDANLVRDVRVTRLGQRQSFQVALRRTPAGGVLVVLRDVTVAAEATRMKTDFVANASHELRTPIAAIKIAFETLDDAAYDDPEQTRRCLTIIGGHLRRLEEMLRDLMDLSRAEAPDTAPDVGPVVPSELLASVRSAMGPLASEKGVALAIDAGDDEPFTSDRKLLDLVVKNLVENAVKYTPAGGQVSAQFGRGAEGVLVTVSDTGVGIPPQHAERVFERFYQVDPARSGSSATRGTGLGLAIVKHAVATLGGRVTLASTVGRGTVVTCVVPALVPSDIRSPPPVWPREG